MKQPPAADLTALLDELPLGGFHVLVVVLCFVTLLVDGMDFATILVTAPAILRNWHLEQSAMGTVFGAGNLGLLIGAVAFGHVGDRYGRRLGIIAGVLSSTAAPARATTGWPSERPPCGNRDGAIG